MKILVTGAKGFVGKNLCAQLNNIKDGKARCYGDVTVEAVYEYDLDSTPEQLDEYCKNADFVFNLAGVNRPQNQEEFMQGNFGFASTLLDTLKKHGNTCPVMLSSSVSAIVSMVAARKQAKICSWSTAKRLAQECSYIASRTCLASGVVQTTIVQWQPSAMLLPMTCLIQSMTPA